MHRPDETSIELATIGGSSLVRVVSPKSQTSRPSLSRPLAPMSPACHPGRSTDAPSLLTWSSVGFRGG